MYTHGAACLQEFRPQKSVHTLKVGGGHIGRFLAMKTKWGESQNGPHYVRAPSSGLKLPPLAVYRVRNKSLLYHHRAV